MDIEQLKELLKGLSAEDLKSLKDYLNSEDTSSDNENEVPNEANESNSTNEETVNDNVDSDNDATDTPDEPKEEQTSNETDEVEDKPNVSENSEETTTDETIDNGNPESEPAETESVEDIPAMQKVAPAEVEDENTANEIVSDDGNKIPVDYEQIVEGLNAKIAALEAENATLKNKVEGAFGYSAKPSVPARVNRLYDDCEDIHIHK